MGDKDICNYLINMFTDGSDSPIRILDTLFSRGRECPDAFDLATKEEVNEVCPGNSCSRCFLHFVNVKRGEILEWSI